MAETVYRIAMLGNEGVGKTALLVRFLCHRFIGEYDPKIEDCYRRTVRVNGEEVTIEILDTACRNSTSQLTKSFLSTADGFVIVYSIIDRKSYLAVPRYKEMIEESRDHTEQGPASFLLIGNKSDLEEHRTVVKREGQTLAERYEWSFGEASAAEYNGVDSCFCDLIREIQARRPKISPCELSPHLRVSSRRSSCDSTEEIPMERKRRPSLKQRLSDSTLLHKINLRGGRH
ncbi:ras-like protein rasD [Oculina patagonica]